MEQGAGLNADLISPGATGCIFHAAGFILADGGGSLPHAPARCSGSFVPAPSAAEALHEPHRPASTNLGAFPACSRAAGRLAPVFRSPLFPHGGHRAPGRSRIQMHPAPFNFLYFITAYT